MQHSYIQCNNSDLELSNNFPIIVKFISAYVAKLLFPKKFVLLFSLLLMVTYLVFHAMLEKFFMQSLPL